MYFDDVELEHPDGATPALLVDRRSELFEDRLIEQRTRLDRMFTKLMLVQWIAAIVVAALYSPIAWAGAHREMDGFLTLALLGGAALSVIPMLMVRLSPGSRGSRQVMGVCQMLFSALFIHLSGGRIETHAHILISLACLGFYLDWRVLRTATIVVVVDHLLRGLLVPETVYGLVHASHWRFVEHALWVVFEDALLFVVGESALRTIREGADREAELERLSESEQNRTGALDEALGELRTSSAVA